MKKAVATVLALVLLAGLAACGGGKSDDPNVGVWNGVSATMMGIEMDVADVFEDGVSLELKANGKFTLNVDGDKGSGKWAYDGDKLKFSADGVDMTGIVAGGILTLEDLLGTGIDLTFEKEGGYPAGSAQGTSAAGDAGYYVLDSFSDGETTLTAEDLAELGLDWYILLNEDGTAVVDFDGAITGTWEPGIIDLGDDGALAYTLEGDVMTLDLEGETMTLRRSNDKPPTVPVAGSLAAHQQWWNGDWYGYWTISGVTDGYAHLDGGRWDCYAVIKMAADDTGTIYLWDAGNAIFTLDISVSEVGGSGFMGAAVSENGSYWDGAEIGHADIIIDPSLYEYDDYMVIGGYYDSASDPGEGFYYWAHLRPWGVLWDDIPNDERPPWYSWYVDNAGDPMLAAIAADEEGSGFIHPGLDGDVSSAGAGENPSAPDGGHIPAPGGDGITTLSYDEMKQLHSDFYDAYTYEEQRKLSYEDVRALMGGVEGEFEAAEGFGYHRYYWYTRDGTGGLKFVFFNDTGLFRECSFMIY